MSITSYQGTQFQLKLLTITTQKLSSSSHYYYYYYYYYYNFGIFSISFTSSESLERIQQKTLLHSCRPTVHSSILIISQFTTTPVVFEYFELRDLPSSYFLTTINSLSEKGFSSDWANVENRLIAISFISLGEGSGMLFTY